MGYLSEFEAAAKKFKRAKIMTLLGNKAIFGISIIRSN
jgi:hypothetical protein